MKKSSIGTKKRNSRNAIALPTSVPAESRSRCHTRTHDVDERTVLVLVVGLPRPGLWPDVYRRMPPLASEREAGQDLVERLDRRLGRQLRVLGLRLRLHSRHRGTCGGLTPMAHDWREAGRCVGACRERLGLLLGALLAPIRHHDVRRGSVSDRVCAARYRLWRSGRGAAFLAESMGAEVAGIDAAEDADRPRTAAATHTPTSALGSMFELPWPDESFDVASRSTASGAATSRRSTRRTAS